MSSVRLLRSPVYGLVATAAAIAFCALWIFDGRASQGAVLVTELGNVPKNASFSMPIFVHVRAANGKLVYSPILHNGLEPAVFAIDRGTYVVTVENCGGTGRIKTTSTVTVVAVLFMTHRVNGRTVCLIRQFE